MCQANFINPRNFSVEIKKTSGSNKDGEYEISQNKYLMVALWKLLLTYIRILSGKLEGTFRNNFQWMLIQQSYGQVIKWREKFIKFVTFKSAREKYHD